VTIHRRARSAEDKRKRTDDLLAAARQLATERGGVRHVTLAAVTELAGLHPSAVRRYFASKEELLLELAEHEWDAWRDALLDHLADARNLSPQAIAEAIAATITSLPLFCDLLTHVPLSLEGEVDVERARRYKSNSFAAYDTIVEALTSAADQMTTPQTQDLIAAALGLTANLWQLSHPTATLAELYTQEPRWGHAALDFEPRLTRLLTATAIGLTATEHHPGVAAVLGSRSEAVVEVDDAVPKPPFVQ
jgi:AcrR family transcriptional regulator